MTLQYSINSIYHVWQRLSVTQRVYRGPVEAPNAYAASNAARKAFGANQYIIRESKHGKIALAYA